MVVSQLELCSMQGQRLFKLYILTLEDLLAIRLDVLLVSADMVSCGDGGVVWCGIVRCGVV